MARKRIEVEIIGNERDLARALGSSRKDIGNWGRSLEGASRVAKRTILGVGLLTAAAVKLGVDFDRTSSQMVGLAGVGERQVERWKEAMLDLAPVVGQTPNELAKALYFISSSGVAASKALGVLETSAKGSAAGLGETAVVADAVTSAMNAYATENLSAAEAADVLAATVREGKGEASEIAPALGNVIPIAAELGVGFNEVGAAIASMTRLGFDAATATTNLSGVFNALLKPAKDSKEALHDVGTSANEVREMLDERGLLSTLQFLEDAFAGNEAQMVRVFRDVRGFRGVLSLIGKAGEDTAEVFAHMEDNTGSLGHAFEAAAETDSFKLQQAWAELQATGIRFGSDVAPAVASMASELADGVHFLGEHRTATQAAALTIVGFSTAVWGANTALRIYNSNLVEATIGKKNLLMIARAAGPIGLVAVGVGTLAFALSRVSSPSEEAAQAIRDLNTQLDIFATRSGEVNASARELAHARLDQKAATLALKSAEQQLDRVQKDSHATSLERKQAALAVEQADQAVADATQRRVRAELENRGAQKAQVDADRKAADVLLNLADKFRLVGRSAALPGAQLESLGNFRAELRNIEQGATQASPRVRDMAGDILALTEKIERVPTDTEIRAALTNYDPTVSQIERLRALAENAAGTYGIDFIIRTHGDIRSPTGLAERQHGGPVLPGHAYVVGEKRPELFVPGERGHIVDHVPSGIASGDGGGRFELFLDDVGVLTGYMRRVADDAGVRRSRRARQIARMGS